MAVIGSLIPPGRPPSSRLHSYTSRVWLAVIAVACIHLVCYRAASPLRLQQQQSAVLSASHHAKRWLSDSEHAKEPVDDSGEALINWQRIWANSTREQKPFLFAGMVLWLFFLFAFVGITASDFFCPNLSTIASRLGLSESVVSGRRAYSTIDTCAGPSTTRVDPRSLLASAGWCHFPRLFQWVAGCVFDFRGSESRIRFSRDRRAHWRSVIHRLGRRVSFDPAVQRAARELTRIVRVYSGTMCLIQPFRVARHTFLRDVGFFTVAITLTLLILWDSHIHLWEALGMVGLYVIYVIYVAVGSWWMSRKERRDELIRAARDEYADEHGYQDEGELPLKRLLANRNWELILIQ